MHLCLVVFSACDKGTPRISCAQKKNAETPCTSTYLSRSRAARNCSVHTATSWLGNSLSMYQSQNCINSDCVGLSPLSELLSPLDDLLFEAFLPPLSCENIDLASVELSLISRWLTALVKSANVNASGKSALLLMFQQLLPWGVHHEQNICRQI